MSLSSHLTPTVGQPDWYVEGVGSDGIAYGIRIMEWTLDKMQAAWENWKKYDTIGDQIPNTFEGLAFFITNNDSLWFEVINQLNGEQVGLVYISNLKPAVVENRYLQATFHAMMWDARVAPRRGLARKFIRRMFGELGLHRMQCEIPLRFGGAIKAMKKIGFTEEGRLREARRYSGVWYDVLLLSVLESEVWSWDEGNQ